MGENKKEGGVEESRVLFIEFYLAIEIISGIIESVDLVYPQGFLVKGIKSQTEAYEQAKNEDEKFSSF